MDEDLLQKWVVSEGVSAKTRGIARAEDVEEQRLQLLLMRWDCLLVTDGFGRAGSRRGRGRGVRNGSRLGRADGATAATLIRSENISSSPHTHMR